MRILALVAYLAMVVGVMGLAFERIDTSLATRAWERETERFPIRKRQEEEDQTGTTDGQTDEQSAPEGTPADPAECKTIWHQCRKSCSDQCKNEDGQAKKRCRNDCKATCGTDYEACKSGSPPPPEDEPETPPEEGSGTSDDSTDGNGTTTDDSTTEGSGDNSQDTTEEHDKKGKGKKTDESESSDEGEGSSGGGGGGSGGGAKGIAGYCTLSFGGGGNGVCITTSDGVTGATGCTALCSKEKASCTVDGARATCQ